MADFASRWIGKRKARMQPIKLRKQQDEGFAVYDGVESVNKIIELP